MDKVDAIAASNLASAAILSTLVLALQRKGLLSDDDVREVYESALQLLEEQRGGYAMHVVIDAARDLIEEHLR